MKDINNNVAIGHNEHALLILRNYRIYNKNNNSNVKYMYKTIYFVTFRTYKGSNLYTSIHYLYKILL